VATMEMEEAEVAHSSVEETLDLTTLALDQVDSSQGVEVQITTAAETEEEHSLVMATQAITPPIVLEADSSTETLTTEVTINQEEVSSTQETSRTKMEETAAMEDFSAITTAQETQEVDTLTTHQEIQTKQEVGTSTQELLTLPQLQHSTCKP